MPRLRALDRKLLRDLWAMKGQAAAVAAVAVEEVGTADIVQPSRVPSRPLGRKIRIRTISRYGRMGATCASVSLSSG